MRESPYPVERSLGISWYATDTRGIGGVLRREPEDFVVREEPAGPRGDTGPYLILRLTKRNWEQQRLVKELARALGISHRRISWAGTKDRRAVTTQYISVYGLEPEAIGRVSLPGVSLEVAGRSGHAIPLGDLRGNQFTIRIRDCDPEELGPRVDEVAGVAAYGFPNYVGIQRFGVIRPVTHLVGE
ncbi:MAG TPA: tRNA pseudouridine(13) synthase TruD, partial [Methanomicrobiales archaeon]|nr:tRNA pseudouridine(13) synthase TruD [Methanomicrobiales archaeon]